MTTEEKAKAYDEAIKYCQYLINERCKEDTDGSFHRADLDKMFPELAESEDEKIRKALIKSFDELLQQNGYKDEVHFKYVNAKDAIAWLEKQGEQKPADFSDLRTWKYIVDAVWTEKEGIGQYLDNPFTEEVAKKLQKRFGNIEQNPWSEEDESRMDNLRHFLEEYGNQYYGHLTLQGTISWLKSLKDRYTWKPSDEQMEYLAKAITTLGDEGDCKTASILNDLRVELKKLKE